VVSGRGGLVLPSLREREPTEEYEKDERVLELRDAVYDFAEAHNLRVGYRASNDALPHISERWIPSWGLRWEDEAGVVRKVQVLVYFQPQWAFPQIMIVSTAWRDDDRALKRYWQGKRPGRRYTIALPIDLAELYETLELAIRDAERIQNSDLTAVSELGPPGGRKAPPDDGRHLGPEG
jgi:hypothetical protein